MELSVNTSRHESQRLNNGIGNLMVGPGISQKGPWGGWNSTNQATLVQTDSQMRHPRCGFYT